MRSFKRAWLVVCLGCLATGARAQDFVTNVSNNGTVAAAFLEIGVGARAEAMGGAYAAEAGRPEMVYWNPAGLAYLQGPATTFMHADWLADLSFDFFAVAAPLPFFNSVLGASFTTLGAPEQPVRTEFEEEGTGQYYDARDYAVNLSLSAQLIPAFSFGLTGKYIHQRIWSESASQFALDAGVFYHTPLEGLRLGASISNFGPDLRLSGKNLTNIIDPDRVNEGITNVPVDYRTDPHPLPQIFRFGVAYDQPLPGRGNMTAAVSLLHPQGATESMNLGLEYSFNQVFFLRGGYQSLFERNAINGLTLGGGLQFSLKDYARFAFDYAWSDWTVLQRTHRVSFGIYL